ncbi:tryptophan synthase subunit alpha [Sulfurospirillum arcachonense]|uniref:tryptophan synthase subunit alpha n=1 Tax=Sulfurospirillum arcachonense TaxID=57666 RepID=UPI000469366D|nr:tryptophan synthase subunit alpha [Sulfurospirillum arcachonense]
MKKLVAYITAGFPNNSFTIDLALALKESGVDSLELGIPFSDPVADGPIIEEANLIALKNGFKIEQLFEISSQIATQIDTLWMGYFNPFYHKGMDLFTDYAKEYGVSGFIIPDLPHEEAKVYTDLMNKKDLSLISFVAPTDSEQRIKQVVENSKKFIYLVAYAGITGSGASEDLSQTITNIRAVTSTPVYVGFGVDEKTAKEKAVGVDGVIVGSAFVKILLDNSLSNNEKIKKISNLAKVIKDTINS